MPNNKLINVKVRDVENIIFEGEVDRISSFNEVGAFDVYPMHANFISIINKALTLYKDKKPIKEVEFEKAIMKVKNDNVKIFLGIETIDLENQENLQKNQSTSKQKKTHS